MNERIDLATLRPALIAAAPEIAIALLGDPNKVMSNPRQLRFGRKGSLSLEVTGSKRGLWRDHSDNTGGDIIALIQRVQRCDFQEALRFGATFVGGAKPLTSPVRLVSSQSDAEATEKEKVKARDIWANTKPFFGSPSEQYLRGRGIIIPPRLDENIGFNPRVFIRAWGDKPAQIFPAMVAAIRDIHSDELIGVHITALDEEAKAVKIDGETLRRVRGVKKGGVIKLTPDDEVVRGLLVGEGIETTLSAMAIKSAQGWAILDASQLAGFPVLNGIETLTIAADADDSGMKATTALTARWTGAGREVIRLVPKRQGADFNDLVRSAVNERI